MLLLGLSVYMSKGQGSNVIHGIQSKFKSLIRVTTCEEDNKQEDEKEENYEEEDGEMEEEPGKRWAGNTEENKM